MHLPRVDLVYGMCVLNRVRDVVTSWYTVVHYGILLWYIVVELSEVFEASSSSSKKSTAAVG